jgi:pyruvate/2-oxoacid:ferredoxin oxidoreductase beta subunit
MGASECYGLTSGQYSSGLPVQTSSSVGQRDHYPKEGQLASDYAGLANKKCQKRFVRQKKVRDSRTG